MPVRNNTCPLIADIIGALLGPRCGDRQEQTTLDMLLAQLLVLSRWEPNPTTSQTKSHTFNIPTVHSGCGSVGWPKMAKMRAASKHFHDNPQRFEPHRRDSSVFTCSVLSDFGSSLGRLHTALSAKRGASSSNCTVPCRRFWLRPFVSGLIQSMSHRQFGRFMTSDCGVH